MDTIKRNDSGVAVEDVQRRLVRAGYLPEDAQTGIFDDTTVTAVSKLCQEVGLGPREEVDDAVWARLVDASFELGDRNLFLRVPFFHGRDVRTLQEALSALGFSCGGADGVFGAHTEEALRRFQTNMGLPTDGIAGAFTFRAILNLQHSWRGKDSFSHVPHLGFARASEVLESNLMCLFGVGDFTRDVAKRMSNLALATNPASQVTSADSLLVEPDDAMIFVQILAGGEEPASAIPVVGFEGEDTLPARIAQVLSAAKGQKRLAVRLPGESWQDAGPDRSAQHYAITLLDALCAALLMLEQR